jgi:hypothetical protein
VVLSSATGTVAPRATRTGTPTTISVWGVGDEIGFGLVTVRTTNEPSNPGRAAAAPVGLSIAGRNPNQATETAVRVTPTHAAPRRNGFHRTAVIVQVVARVRKAEVTAITPASCGSSRSGIACQT